MEDHYRAVLAELKFIVVPWDNSPVYIGRGDYVRLCVVHPINSDKGWEWQKRYFSVEEDVYCFKKQKLHRLLTGTTSGFITFKMTKEMSFEQRVDFARLMCAMFPLQVWYKDKQTKSYKWIRDDKNPPESGKYKL